MGTGVGIDKIGPDEFLCPHTTIEWAQQFPRLQIFAVDRVIPYAAVRFLKKWGLFNAQGKLIAMMQEGPPDYTRVVALEEQQVSEMMRDWFNQLYQSGLNQKKRQSDSPERIRLGNDAEIIFKPFELYAEKKGINNIVFIPADFNDLARVKELEGVKFDFGRMFNVTRHYEPDAAVQILNNLSGFFKTGAVLIDGQDVGHTDIMFSVYTRQQNEWKAKELWFLWSMYCRKAPQDEIIYADISLPVLVCQNQDIAKKTLEEFKEISDLANSQGRYYTGEDFKNLVIKKLQEKGYSVLPQPKGITHLIGISLFQGSTLSVPTSAANSSALTLCLTPDSLITLANGSQKPLIELSATKPGGSAVGRKAEGGKPLSTLKVNQEVEGDMVLSLNEATGKLEPHRVLALLDMGVKPVYRITTASGKTLKTTLTHPYLTRNGWRKLSEIKAGEEVAAVSESSGNTVGANNRDFISSNNYRRIKEASSCILRPNAYAQLVSESDILWDKIISIESLGELPVYDIEVEGTHNFIAEGIVAHNTYTDVNSKSPIANRKEEETAGSALNSKGGIDLNPQNLEMEIKGAGTSPVFMNNISFDLQNFQGFTFQIISIQPAEQCFK